MTEAESAYSPDYLDLVARQLGRRPLFKLGAAVLALLYAVAIYAPFLAGDRPFALEAVDARAYRAALRTLSAVTSSMTRLFDEPAGARAALELERRAGAERLVVLRRHLSPADAAPLDELERLWDGALDAHRAARAAEAERLCDEALALARELRTELEPGRASLRPVRSYPLFESLHPVEVFFMVLWLCVLAWPAWNPLVNAALLRRDSGRIRRWRRRKWILCLGGSALAGLAWLVAVGTPPRTFDVAPYKAGLSSGDIVASRPPRLPPLPMAYAETHSAEGFRPPTWTRASELDADGRYVRGLRRSRPDRVTGVLPPATPVLVRYGEPAANSPWRHLAGTDQLGRDFLVRMVWGSRVSLSVGILSAALLTVFGVVVGAASGYLGGWVDLVAMRLIEILQSIPALFLILLAMAFTDPEVVHPIVAIVVVIALIRWTGVARLVRGEFLRLRDQEFVMAARALGLSPLRTIVRHVLPNALGPILVSAAFAVAAGILTESVVSYLGFGVRHPEASWGSLVNDSKSAEHWWIQLFPGVLIFLTVTCYNLVGDAVRDALDPKMKVFA